MLRRLSRLLVSHRALQSELDRRAHRAKLGRYLRRVPRALRLRTILERNDEMRSRRGNGVGYYRCERDILGRLYLPRPRRREELLARHGVDRDGISILRRSRCERDDEKT